jgi:hypothetical protein
MNTSPIDEGFESLRLLNAIHERDLKLGKVILVRVNVDHIQTH